MKSTLWLGFGAAIILSLALMGMAQVSRGETDDSRQTSQEVLASLSPCGPSAPEQPIPDDGRWLQICLLDPMAPEATTVTAVHLKYLIEHPDPNQLEVHLRREDVGIEQVVWERGKTVGANEFGKSGDLAAFHGVPSEGYWYLWIRDAVPGRSGWLKGASLAVEYAQVGPLPILLSGTPGRLTSRRLPAGVTPSQTPDRDSEKSERGEVTLLSAGGWQEIKRETFEGAFPNTGWTLIDANPNDGKEYLWDDDDYRAHPDPNDPYPWAAWQANGGANGYDPATNPRYPPNMASWMIYGPFDLSEARAAEAVFWLWRQIEVNYDRVFFGVSPDGTTFYSWQWDGTADWQEMRFGLDSYLGDASVWVGWLFESDRTVQYEGPWVDDILIRKYVPGQVTVQGTLTYADRDGSSAPGRFTTVYLYDQDPGGVDDLLAVGSTDANGFFQFPALTNWDEDGTDSDPNNRRLDVYLVLEADNEDSASACHRVTNFDGHTYIWTTSVLNDIADGLINLGVPIPGSFPTLEAMWIFQDLRRAWESIESNTGIDPGSVTARWEKDQNTLLPCVNSSCFYAGAGGPYIFIAHNSVGSGDTVVHEAGHHHMWNKTGWWLWWDIGCYNHQLFSQEDVNCAWSEGWADFLPLVVNGDECYDFGRGPCGAGGGAFENLETRSRNDLPPLFPWGDAVEGRVAGSLYDLFDNTNEDFDSATFGFAPIVDIVFQAPHEDRFSAFWDSWKVSGQNKHHTVRAIWQNTIDYDTSPRFEPPLPARTVLQGFGWENAIDLWAYSSDEESNDWELEWQIVYVSDWRCRVTIDAGDYVDLYPQAGWLGSCDVTLRVSDSLKTADDTFRVNVVPVQAEVFLPLVLKSSP